MRSTFTPLVLFLTSAMSSQTAAQEPPDYIEFINKAKRLAVAGHSVGSCKHFGYRIDEAGLKTFGFQFVDEAVRDGIPEGNANLLINAEVDAEGERQEARVERTKANADDPETVKAFMDYWRERCSSLSADPVYGRFFKEGP